MNCGPSSGLTKVLHVQYIFCRMTRRTSRTFRLDPDLVKGLEDLRVRDGVPISEQVRRALRTWLDSKGIKAERKRAATRRRS